MMIRRDLLLRALEEPDPSVLPMCEWYGRRCDYQEICGCGSGKGFSRAIEGCGVEMERDRKEEERLGGLLTESGSGRIRFELGDLVFPRKAFLKALTTEPEEDWSERRPVMQREGFNRALRHTVQFGFHGEFVSVPAEVRRIAGKVGVFKGVPTIIRTNRWREMIPREELPAAQPHYFDRLALECAATGIDQGRLIIYYERLAGDRFLVYDLAFRDLGEVFAEAERRAELLLAGAEVSRLPACPTWLARFCTYQESCGCGVERASDREPG